MAQDVTLGGDRLGSGNKQKVELHNYQMNSFNLEQDFKSSMAPGILYPFIKMVGTNHGTFDIDLDSFVRTLPTKGPLFGSFKLQADLFCVPIRLYQGILHNNPVGIGLKMNQVYLPKLEIYDYEDAAEVAGSNFYNQQIAENSLLKYLGFSGMGLPNAASGDNNRISRKINAVPILAYYDIFKCYYSNKQEEYAYVITPGSETTVEKIKLNDIEIRGQKTSDGRIELNKNWDETEVILYFNQNIEELIRNGNITLQDIIGSEDIAELFAAATGGSNIDVIQLSNFSTLGLPNTYHVNNDTISFNWICYHDINTWETNAETSPLYLQVIQAEWNTVPSTTADIKLQPFKLENIDKMRNALLSRNDIGDEVLIYDLRYDYPYSALTGHTSDGKNWNAFALNGLVVKTYQSDLFNNWLETSAIDMINSMTAISTSGGSFTVDSLNFAEKYYEVLNRIQVSGGTYEDWQEAVYGEGAVRKAETPMYVGGMSAEVMFEEVISTAETNVSDDFQALGSLGGKGTQVGKKGGNNIHIKCDEPCYIMGIVSLTPRICYSQGNDWDLTELDTLDDLHKPGMDGIGFQDLIVEQMAWWDTKIAWDEEAKPYVYSRNSAGKQTAWINYQTAIDKCYGDFAKQDGYGFMVLNRNYEVDTSDNSVKDITTYIDPRKYNYAFAYDELAAQNFWVQIHSRVVARRKMGAQQIPNL